MHLRVLRMAAIHMLMCLLNLYEYAKKNLGPLRSTVGTVERALITVVGPVCQKFKGVPDDFLAFLDTKVNNKSLLKMKEKTKNVWIWKFSNSLD